MRKGAMLFGLLVACAGCGSSRNDGQPASGGATAIVGGAAATGGAVASGAAAGTPGAGSGGVGAAGSGGAAGSADPCPEVRAPQREGGSPVELTFVPVLGGAPFEVAQPVSVAGGQLTPLNLRFYVSELSLQQADGTGVPVDLLSASGAVAPFGVQLVNFDEPDSTHVRFKAPPGTYSGVRLTLGINDACNAGSASRAEPLSTNSEMVWPHLAGYLFLRYEAQWVASDPSSTTAAPPTMIHMGGTVGKVFAPQASIAGGLTVPATGELTRTVRVSFDEIFSAASTMEEVTNVLLPSPEVIAGERLRRGVPTAPIFELAEP